MIGSVLWIIRVGFMSEFGTSVRIIDGRTPSKCVEKRKIEALTSFKVV